jgi:hypothetical protein
MNKRLLVITFLLCLVFFAMFKAALGQTIIAGVNNGDSFTYHLSSYWTSSDPFASIPASLLNYNHTAAVEVRIDNVIGSDIAILIVTYFSNGSDPIPLMGSVNLQSGESYGGFSAIISSYLVEGERIHPLGPDTITINQTVTKNFESGSRQTNRIHITARNETIGATSSVDRYFDKVTGILVESTDETSYDNPSEKAVITWTLVASSVWSIPEFPVILALPIVMVVTAFAVIAYKKKYGNISMKLTPQN